MIMSFEESLPCAGNGIIINISNSTIYASTMYFFGILVFNISNKILS
jgi:hypothetical protein